jgi:chromosome segregation ATPase
LPDKTIIDVLSQVPISVALLLVLLYFVRTNRQDRHELNDISATQSRTSLLSAQNQERLTERVEQTESSLASVSAKLESQSISSRQLIDASTALSQATKELGLAITQIRTRAEADKKHEILTANINAHTDLAVKPVTDMVATLPTAVTLIGDKLDKLPDHLDALRLKLTTDIPPIVKETYDQLVAELKASETARAAATSERDLAVAALTQIREQLVETTGLLVEAEAARQVLSARITEQEERIRSLSTPPVVLSLDTSAPPSGTPDAPPEGVPA